MFFTLYKYLDFAIAILTRLLVAVLVDTPSYRWSVYVQHAIYTFQMTILKLSPGLPSLLHLLSETHPP